MSESLTTLISTGRTPASLTAIVALPHGPNCSVGCANPCDHNDCVRCIRIKIALGIPRPDPIKYPIFGDIFRFRNPAMPNTGWRSTLFVGADAKGWCGLDIYSDGEAHVVHDLVAMTDDTVTNDWEHIGHIDLKDS